jgi:glycosyltransferase involved in cell wall biosynthesis
MKGKSDQVNSRTIKAVHVGISGFPFGSAAINKCLAVYQSLRKQDVEFLIINNKAIHKKNIPVSIEKSGTIENIKYVYTPYSPYRSGSFWMRRISNVSGRWNELLLLIGLARRNEIDVMFFYPDNGSFAELIYYRILSKLFSFPLISHYVEYRTSFYTPRLFERISDLLFDKYFMRFIDAVLPISQFLIEHLKRRGLKKPYLKIPPLVDFSKFKRIEQKTEPYFLYVGTAGYMDAIQFITQAFDKMTVPGISLYMVINGKAQDLKTVENLIKQMTRSKDVKCFSSLSYDDLIQKYIHAKALLIPLKDTIQDRARFPQKIAEYLASGNPIITTNYGEVAHYFRDDENALVAPHYDIGEYSKKMEFVVEFPERASDIGKRGHATGLKYFDLNSYAVETRKLIVQLLQRRSS